jgi:transcriptional regulator with XRE-family HTH domain
MAKTKGPIHIDAHVGSRMRTRRMMLGMSQEKLATGLSLTFQQVQKYEKGANRMGASRLQQAADISAFPSHIFSKAEPMGRSSRLAVCRRPMPTILLQVQTAFDWQRRSCAFAHGSDIVSSIS